MLRLMKISFHEYRIEHCHSEETLTLETVANFIKVDCQVGLDDIEIVSPQEIYETYHLQMEAAGPNEPYTKSVSPFIKENIGKIVAAYQVLADECDAYFVMKD